MKKILIAASGTGGHLIPALAIAEQLKNKNFQIEFIGSGRYLEQELVDRAGYSRHLIKIVGVKNRGIFGKLEFLFLLPKAIFDTVKIIKETKAQMIIGVGGYISVLPVIIGKLCGLQTLIHEAELHPGLANKILRFFSSYITTASLETFSNFNNRLHVGHILRKEIFEVPPLEISEIKRVLVMGGSQGSQALDLAVLKLADYFIKNEIEIWHQCRKDNLDFLRNEYQQKGVKAKVESFIEDPVQAYTWAQVVIARSGAGTVQELNIVGRPAILIPLPLGQEQHQNAEYLERQGKALIVKESAQLAEDLILQIETLKDLNNLKLILSKFTETQTNNAAAKIAELVEKLLYKAT